MSIYKRGGNVQRRSWGRAILFVGLILAAAIWVGLVPGASELVRRFDLVLQDRLSLILEPQEEREDLVFLGISQEWRKGAVLSAADLEASRALRLLREDVGNHQLDRRIYADLVEKLAAAGAKAIIFDVLFVGASGDGEADREFAAALNRHYDRVILSVLLRPVGNAHYEPVSSVQQLPMLSRAPGRTPHEGYVNLWPDAEDGVVRRMVHSTSLAELATGERAPYERIYRSLAAVTAEFYGKKAPEGETPRLRYAVGEDREGNSTYALAYAPHSIHRVFVPGIWETEYDGGAFFKDKVVLISTSTKEDGDYHPIPGATIYGGQFHLQALGALLEDSYWQRAPQWVDVVALLGMAALAVIIGIAFRHPLAILSTSLALGGGFVVACAWISAQTGVLFAGTPGLLGLGLVTVCAELGQLVGRSGAPVADRAGRVRKAGDAVQSASAMQ